MQLASNTQQFENRPAPYGAGPASPVRDATDFVVDQLLPLVPGLLEQMEEGANLLLADCGGGKALHRMARRFMRSRFVGIDELTWNVASAASHSRATRIGNLWFQEDTPEIELPAVYHVVVSLNPTRSAPHDPHWFVRIAGAVRPGGALFLENDNGTARAALLAMGFRRICEMRPSDAPHRRFIVAVR